MSRSTSRRSVLRAAGLGAPALALVACSPDAGSSAGGAATARATHAPLRVELTTARGGDDGVVTGPRSSVLVVLSAAATGRVTVTGADGAAVAGQTREVASSAAASSTSSSTASSSAASAAASSAATPTPATRASWAWTPTEALTAGAAYTATAEYTSSGASTPVKAVLRFTVATADQQVGAKMMPLHGEVVGVGMPVVVIFTTPVPAAERSALTDAMSVRTTGDVEGAWRWIGASEVHWRPREYWPKGTSVQVKVPLADEVVGGKHGSGDRDVSFTVGDSHISVADTNTHQMTTSVNGEVVKTTPISAGREDADPHFVTRSGPHLVSEKYATYFMDGATVGLDYAETVQWATRIANSGEFVHAAPWSVASQGHANVSHGCLNASPDDARWFYELARRGDVVEVTGTDRPLELTNGLGDWTLTWDQWTAPQTT